jgi:protein-tyrosine-phosphatase/catechol 2,3-dioxygenase-like lactoylglutathione lyase family enzyme
MKRLHVHVAVDDLERSVRFYSALFAAQPSVLKADYAKWMLDDPRVNFAISTRGREAGLDHLGIQVENKDELAEVYSRLQKAGGTVIEQGKTTCCYAKSEKSWIDDPAGIAWETFLTTGESTEYGDGTGEREARVANAKACCNNAEIRRDLLPGRVRSGMADRPYNVLFLCTGNSARSIMAEAILNKVGAGKFRAYSAGSQSKGRVHPETLHLLQSLGYNTSGFRSKSWSEFAKPGAPPLDFVFTVCDNAAGEACPAWPGQPMTAHWGITDPAEATDSAAEVAVAFKDAYRMLNQRIAALPLRSLDELSLQRKLNEIGRMTGATAQAVEPS